MTTARQLAEAVGAMSDCDGRLGVKWDAVEFCDARDKAYCLASEILSAPQPQPSATVAKIRLWAIIAPTKIDRDNAIRWADELEAAQARIAELEAKLNFAKDWAKRVEGKLALA